MLKKYRTVFEGSEGEITEKKSRFIATVLPVHSEEEAIGFIEQMRKKYWNATHNCFAYVIGEHFEIQRCSDDGEPGGTAGKPMLDVLMGEELHDTAVVVTRYFGGTLLGTGGLVRAYQAATKAGLLASTVITKYLGKEYVIGTDYTGLGKLQYLTASRQIIVLDTLYEDCVKMKILLDPEQAAAFHGEVMDVTSGKAVWQEQEEIFYARVNDRVLTGEDLHPKNS